MDKALNVGIVGLGKLGLPVAMAIASRGIDVYGTDVHTPDLGRAMDQEEGFTEAMVAGHERFHFTERLGEVVANSDVIFVAVQTPHQPRFEGITPLPADRADFDYRYLRDAVGAIEEEAHYWDRQPTIAVISTVLPGTMAREIEPLLDRCNLVYNPSFIAMGTTISDFLRPEFVLIGGDEGYHAVADVYDRLGLRLKIVNVSIVNAELAKVLYNTFIGLKIAFANTAMEICEAIEGCDVDVVMGVLKHSRRRLISSAYLRGGMGDGGACHPRDNIALSGLARELDLSFDLFEATMEQRERQAAWLADLMLERCEHRGLGPGILGIAYKPGSSITTGSPALLVAHMLEARTARSVALYDPYVNAPERSSLQEPRVWLVGCDHPAWPEELPQGSVVIDPWRTWPDQDGVEVIRLGSARVKVTA